MKMVICGGSGQISQILARSFHERGDEVVVVSRKLTKNPGVACSGIAKLWERGLLSWKE